MLTLIGLLALTTLFYGQVLLGWKKRYSFLVMTIGNLIYVYVSLNRSPMEIDLLIPSTIFAIVSMRNWILWGRELEVSNECVIDKCN